MDSIDSLGVVKSVTQQVMVNRSLYKATILVYNEAGEVVKHLYAYTDDLGKATVMEVLLSTNVIKPSYSPVGGTPSQLAVILSSGTTVIWNGMSDSGNFVQSGQYYVEVHSSDGKGGDSTVTKQVSVIGIETTGIILAEPNILDSTKGNTSTTFTAYSTQPLSLNACLYTVAGERVAILDGPIGQGTVKWNAVGFASGIYIAVVTAKDSNGGLAFRRILKVALLH